MITTLLAFVFVLGLLVFVHELGHFIAAKKSGIRVETFSLGFPPKLIGKKYGETEYQIGVIPLGGYVKMMGEYEFDDDYVPKSGDFTAASIWKRYIVIAAGPIMNFITAILLFFIIYWASGIPEPVPGTIGANSIMPGGPADEAKMNPGSRILSIDGIEFTDQAEVVEYIHGRPDIALTFAWQDGDSVITREITPQANTVKDSLGNETVVGQIGVGIGSAFEYKPTGPIRALTEGINATVYLCEQMLYYLYKFVTFQISIKNFGGPIMIAEQAGRAAQQGFLALLGLAAFLSVNLALLNILPIPVLDGGHLVFLTIEAIKRRPVSLKGRLIAQQIGMAVLLLFMVAVTYNDILRVVGGIFN